MRFLRCGVVAGLVPLLVACNGDRDGMPVAWSDLRLGTKGRCPDVAGRYFDGSEPITHLMARRRVPWDSVNADWAYFELSGDANTGLAVRVVYRDSVVKSGTLRKGSEWSGDYYCEDGWLKINDEPFPMSWDSEMKSGDFYPKRHAFRLAATRHGTLVGRLDFIDYEEFIVWCGDGCRGIPIPGTFVTKSRWSMAEKFDPGIPPPVARKRQSAIDSSRAELEQAMDDRIWQQDQEAERGPIDPMQDVVRRRALSALMPSMLLRGVGPNGTGWHLSLEFDEPHQLTEFMERLAGSGLVADMRVAPLSRTRTTTGRMTDVVFVRYER